MPIICDIFLKISLQIWCKNRDTDFNEYSYSKKDLLKRSKFTFKVLMITIFPLLLIVFFNILNFIHLLNSFEKLEYNILQIVISIIIVIPLLIIQWVCYKRLVNFDNYISICKKYNVINEKREFEILTIIETLYFDFSIVIFIIDII